MILSRSPRMLLLGAIVIGIIAGIRWTTAAPAAEMMVSAVIPLIRASSETPAEPLASIEAATVANDPFRLSNTPPITRYDPSLDGAAPGPGLVTPPGPRPTLVLKGIVGGPPWQAIIDGFPGHEPGTVARQGSVYDRLTILSVTRDSVVIRGPDTTWVLSFRRGS